MIITHKVNLDLKRPSWVAPIDVVQDDKYSRKIELTLTCGGEAWDIPGGTTPVILYSKADGTGGSYDTMPDGSVAWTIADNVLTIKLAPQVLTAAGTASLAVTLTRGQLQLTTFRLLLNVHPMVGKDLAPSDNYYHVPGFLPAPANSKAGQFFRTAAVDENGHVTKVESVDVCLPTAYSEEDGIGRQQNPVDPTHSLWSQWNGRLGFGMNTETAPVPFLVNGQLLTDGTIIAHNTGNPYKNRWCYHVFEAYAVNNYARLTMLLDKHMVETDGKPSSEIYYYTGNDHTAASYGNTKIGSDVAFHSFCFDRDKLTAYGEIDSKMPITLARISLSKDLNTACSTVTEADAAYEPDLQSEENIRCLKYLALKNAENGAMFYDADRNCPVCKIDGQWCDLPFTVITDSAYDILQESGGSDSGEAVTIAWESGVIGGYGDMVVNAARLRTADYLPETVTTVTAAEGYEVCLVVLREDGTANNDCYYNPNDNTKTSSPTWTSSLDISNVAFDGYPKRKLIARRSDQADIDVSEGSNITVSYAGSQ